MTGVQILLQLFAVFALSYLVTSVSVTLIPDSLADMEDPPDPCG